MSLSICARCLSRLHAIPQAPLITCRTFSTTRAESGSATNRKKKSSKSEYRQPTNKGKKKKPRVVPKLPMVGERKALRKRIVLSNTNALEVQGMQDLDLHNMADESQIGRVLGLNGELLEQLREIKMFKPTQNWNMFQKPGTLMRRESVELAWTLMDITAGHAEDKSRTVRRIFAGDRGTGKSLMLLQAVSMAFLNEWVVINVPEGQDYTIAQSAYAPMDPSSEQQPSQDQAASTPPLEQEASHQIMYNQPKLTAELLQRVSKSNEKVLKQLSVVHTHDIAGHKPENLHNLSIIGAENPGISWLVWQSLWKELTSPSQRKRPPVLVALDGIDHWMTLSKYRSPEYSPIHAHQLMPIHHFLQVLFDQDRAGQLANGGLILASTTASNSPSLPTFGLLLKQLEATQRGQKMGDEGFPMPQPYKPVDQRVLELLPGGDGLEVQRLKGLEKDVEARGLLEYFAKSGVMRETVSDALVGEKWSLAGGGVIGEMARYGKRLKA